MSVRLVNIPADECLPKVKEGISEPGADIPHNFIYFAHRVGNVEVDENGSKNLEMIIKFTT